MNISDPIERLALDIAAAIRVAVAPHLGQQRSRTRVGSAPGGDVTMAIDEIAEHVLLECAHQAGDIAFYSEDQGFVSIGRPRAVLIVDPIDGTRPAAAGLESCCASVAVAPPSEDATLGDVTFGVVHELKTGDWFAARRGTGAWAQHADGTPLPLLRSTNTDLSSLFWTAGYRGRPALPVTLALEELIDGCSMGGSFFELGSATFNLTRLVTGQLDAYVDVGRRLVDEFPDLAPAFLRVGEGAICTNFPYDVAAAALIVHEAGGIVTYADGRRLAAHPAVGSGSEYGLAVLGSATEALHALLLEAIDRGFSRLREWPGGRSGFDR